MRQKSRQKPQQRGYGRKERRHKLQKTGKSRKEVKSQMTAKKLAGNKTKKVNQSSQRRIGKRPLIVHGLYGEKLFGSASGISNQAS